MRPFPWVEVAGLALLSFAAFCSWDIGADFRRYGRLANDDGHSPLGYAEHVGIGAVVAALWLFGLWLVL